MSRKQERTSYDAKPKARPAFNMDALVQGGPDIEVVEADGEFQKLAEDTKFMNETVYVRFLSTGNPNDPTMVELGVNTIGANGKSGGLSVRRGYERGRVYPMPRYLLEVAAHAKTTTLEQVPDPRNPVEKINVERHSFFYPFECVRDDNPKGRMWLDRVMNDPA